MILEIARIRVKAGLEAEFEASVAKARSIFARAKGCRSAELRRSIEEPSRYELLVRWDTLEHHTIDFRNSDDFKEWRNLVAHCFDGAPDVGHTKQSVQLL